MTTLLVLDTATERLTLGLQHGGRRWSHSGAGGAKASTTLLAAIARLLCQGDVALRDLDAIGFGRGPGAFTGLRTACSVAQGLAFGSAKLVLPIDNLLAIAEDARGGAAEFRVWALADARMQQIYAAEYAYAEGRWRGIVAPMLTDAEALSALWQAAPPQAVAAEALQAFGAGLRIDAAVVQREASATANAFLTLAASAWADDMAVDPAQALPLYVRDKVAETTVERAAARAAKELRSVALKETLR